MDYLSGQNAASNTSTTTSSNAVIGAPTCIVAELVTAGAHHQHVDRMAQRREERHQSTQRHRHRQRVRVQPKFLRGADPQDTLKGCGNRRKHHGRHLTRHHLCQQRGRGK